MLRKLKISIVLVLTLLFSCNEEESLISPEESIKDNWSLVSLHAETEFLVTVEGTIYQTTITSNGANFNYSVSFENNTYKTNGQYDLTSFVTINDKVFPPNTQLFSEITFDGNYTLSDELIELSNSLVKLEEFNGTPEISELQREAPTFELLEDELVISQFATKFIVEPEDVKTTTNLTVKSTAVFKRN